MSKLNSWHPNDRTVYLKHPTSKRVLALAMSALTDEFIQALRRDSGYLPATAADYQAQQEARERKGESA